MSPATTMRAAGPAARISLILRATIPADSRRERSVARAPPAFDFQWSSNRWRTPSAVSISASMTSRTGFFRHGVDRHSSERVKWEACWRWRRWRRASFSAQGRRSCIPVPESPVGGGRGAHSRSPLPAAGVRPDPPGTAFLTTSAMVSTLIWNRSELHPPRAGSNSGNSEPSWTSSNRFSTL